MEKRLHKHIPFPRLLTVLVAIFLGLVLFNTTYLDLGTIVPLIVIFFTIGVVLFKYGIRKVSFNSIIIFVLIAFFSTFVSGGNDYRELVKILLTVFFFLIVISIPYKNEEVKFLSFMLCLLYVIYAILVIQSIGLDTAVYGRVTIIILGGDIPLDPNVTATAFVLPVTICTYNALYGKYRLLAFGEIFVVLVAMMACSSRGAFLGLLGAVIIVADYVFHNKTSLLTKMVLIIIFVMCIKYALFDFLKDDSLFGIERIIDYQGDDTSNGRTKIWSEKIGLLTSSLYAFLLGYGNNYSLGYTGHVSHNTILQIFYYGGLLGFICFFKPIVRLFRRKTINNSIKYALFASVFIPIFFIDTLEERTLWNFLIFYTILSSRNNADNYLIWFEKR